MLWSSGRHKSVLTPAVSHLCVTCRIWDLLVTRSGPATASCPPWRRWPSPSIRTTTSGSASERCCRTKALTSWTRKNSEPSAPVRLQNLQNLLRLWGFRTKSGKQIFFWASEACSENKHGNCFYPRRHCCSTPASFTWGEQTLRESPPILDDQSAPQQSKAAGLLELIQTMLKVFSESLEQLKSLAGGHQRSGLTCELTHL